MLSKFTEAAVYSHGVVVVAFFEQEKGISTVAKTAGASWVFSYLLASESLSVLVGGTSAMFFFVATKLNIIRLHNNHELISELFGEIPGELLWRNLVEICTTSPRTNLF